MKIFTAVLMSILAAGGDALAQPEPAAREPTRVAPQQSAPEEVIVRGRRLTELRFEVEQAQERAYAIFNEINSDDDFDVYCREERKYHSRATQRTCRPQFENRISAEAARAYMAELNWTCQPNQEGFLDTQACMFSGPGVAAKATAQGVEGQLPGKRDQMSDEIVRLANQDDRFAQAILDWYEKTETYEAARKRRRED
jgi:hypothetical protein